jgi:hypothetical protein
MRGRATGRKSVKRDRRYGFAGSVDELSIKDQVVDHRKLRSISDPGQGSLEFFGEPGSTGYQRRSDIAVFRNRSANLGLWLARFGFQAAYGLDGRMADTVLYPTVRTSISGMAADGASRPSPRVRPKVP